MAETRILTNDGLTRKRWAKDLFRIVLPAVEFNSLVGKGADAIVQMRDELGKGEGDRITFGIRLPLTGEGRVGDQEVEGHEEKLLFRNFTLDIEELNHAVNTGGKMEEQRIPYDLLKEGKDGLQNWWSEKLSDYLINVLCGNSGYRIAGEVFAQAINEPDSVHHLTVDDVAEGSITANEVLDMSFLNRMKQKAELCNQYSLSGESAFKVRPLKIKGKSYYKVIMHNFVFDALRESYNIGDWGDLKRNAMKLEMPDAEIEYNGMIIMKSERVPKISTVGSGGVYRTILCGAQSAVWGWGGAGESKSTIMSFVPYTNDAKRFLNVRGGGIFGMAKTRFNSMDYGIMTGSSYAAALA